MGRNTKTGTIVRRTCAFKVARHTAAAAVILAAALWLLLLLPDGAAAEALSAGDVQIYHAAFEAADGGNWAAAHQTAARARNPLLAKVLRWLDLGREDGDADYATIAAFIRANPDWPNLTALRRQAERVMPDSTPASQIAAWFQANPPLTADGLLRHARALQALGRRDEARTLVRRMWPEIRLTPEEQSQVLGEFGAFLSAADHAARLDALLWADREVEARRMFPLVDAGHQTLALARLALAGSEPGVDGAVARVPAGLAEDEGLSYERVRWRRRAEQFDGAIELIARQPANSRHAREWWTERNILTRTLFNRGDRAGAYRLVSNHRQREGQPFSEAEWFAGWLALRFLNQPAKAFEHFQRLYNNVNTPISLSRGAYWSGRAQEAMGDRDEANRWYRIGAQYGTAFYGQLSAGKVGLPTVAGLPADPAIPAAASRSFEQEEFVRIARALDQIGESDRADIFLRQLIGSAEAAERFALVGRLAVQLNHLQIAVRAGKQAAQNGVTLVESSYPVLPLTTADARPERALLLALIRQESEFRRDAVSSAGARGLMQLMPATAQTVARALGVPHSTDRLTDANHNIRLGSTYVADRIERFNGSYILAIAAYNAGPRRVEEWLDQFGDPHARGVDVIDWIESIPISETRNYVQRVLENTQVYRLRLGAAPQTGGLERDLRR